MRPQSRLRGSTRRATTATSTWQRPATLRWTPRRVYTGKGTISLAADVNADGTGNDGVGTLSIDAGATVASTNPTANAITLRGAKVNIATGANPAVVQRRAATEHHAHRHPHRAGCSQRPGVRLQRQPLRGQLRRQHGERVRPREHHAHRHPHRAVLSLGPGVRLQRQPFRGQRRQRTVSEFAPGSTTPTATLTGVYWSRRPGVRLPRQPLRGERR